MRRLLFLALAVCCQLPACLAQTVAGAMPSYNEPQKGEPRTMQYTPQGDAFVCENGKNHFTRALYGSHTDYRVETSDVPIFAVTKKGHHKSVRFEIEGVPLDSTDYCKAWYRNGMRTYLLGDHRWNNLGQGIVRVHVVALPDEEGAIWQFICDKLRDRQLEVKVLVCDIANPKMKRNGDLGADEPGIFEPSPTQQGLVVGKATRSSNFAHLVMHGDSIFFMHDGDAFKAFNDAVDYNKAMAKRVQFDTPDPFINTLGGALVMAADGDWDGQTWLHGCIGWRMPLAGWRAAYAGDVLGWNDRAVSHFDAYAKSQVTSVEPTIEGPSQDPAMNMARAEKKWGTQMYSNGYICRNPERNDQMHHYDMNLNYIDELLWHFQYDADRDYMRKMWPVIKAHLAWEKRNFDADGDHLYDAYCCIWASDALYYNGGAVTHSSAYNYRGNLLAARIAELIGEDPTPYRQEADAILKAMNERLWMPEGGHWAEYQDAMGLKRLHESAAVWSIYTPIDCGACSPEQAYKATQYVDREIPHFKVDFYHQTIATTNWLPYCWSVNNVAAAEVMHTALAFFEAGRPEEAYKLMKGNILDQMYYGQSPANFGQLSHYDAARGECYRDFGDCIGISSRTLLQGLFGVVPQALYGECIIRPGFPAEWGYATLKTPYIEYKFTREGNKERYEITQNFCQPLKMVIRQNLGGGQYRDFEGTSELHQVIEIDAAPPFGNERGVASESQLTEEERAQQLGLSEPSLNGKFMPQTIDKHWNASVDDIFKNKYLEPRPKSTSLEIPAQGVGEWCHPQYTPEINDSVFRTLIKRDVFTVAGVPFRTLKKGPNIVYTSLWKNYPDAVTIPLKGRAASAYLLMAGSTNHMQCHIDNGVVTVTYKDGSTDQLLLRNPENWCPIEQDYYVDGEAFQTMEPRPYRICLGTGDVSRDLGEKLGIKGVYGREIPGGAAQMLRMPLNPHKQLKNITVRTLSNDVVIGLMAITLQASR
ncbi:MAG: DUF4450 domain-containing protein [Prevotella sp.]|nr:DUF4450 domain-containing protein [Prevotella sp.]